MYYLWLITLISAILGASSIKQLDKVFEWRNLEFGFSSESERNSAIRKGIYNPDIPVPYDIDVYYPPKGGAPRHFITTPRDEEGVPYSLSYVTKVQRRNGSELQPYPSYDWHRSKGKDCDGLTSAFRMHIDPCGRMWVVDTGFIECQQRCPPQVVAIDLATNKLVHRFRIPASLTKVNVSSFVTVLADVSDPPPHGSCKQTFLYLCDILGFGIVVYDVDKKDSWRIENKYTRPNPNFKKFTIAGESFELFDGPVSVSVTPPGLGLKRNLFFHALANDLEVAIPLDIVNNPSKWKHQHGRSQQSVKELGRRGVQCAASAISNDGFWFCVYMNPIALHGWNIRKPYASSNVKALVVNNETLQFVSGMKVVRRPSDGREELWMLSNRIQKSFAKRNYKEINYRVQRSDIDYLILGQLT